jgi:hypothetical protein
MPSTKTDLVIRGTLSPSGLLKMSVDQEKELNDLYFPEKIVNSLLSTLNECNSYLEEGISTMRVDRLNFTITATFSGQRKIPEKSGVM